MAKLNEIIYSLKNIKAGGIQSDDVKLSDENYVDIINYYRAKLIRQAVDRKERLDPLVIQPLYGADRKGLEVERVVFNRGEPLSGKTVFRTKDKLPRAIATAGTNLVTFVGHNLLGKAFQRATPYNVHLLAARTLTGLEPKWFEFDERIYVVTEDSLSRVVVQLVAENPLKVLELNGELNEYNPLDTEYPMSDTLRDSMIKLIADAEYKVLGITDDSNDSLDNPTNKQQ
jgi:hypothetical protein